MARYRRRSIHPAGEGIVGRLGDALRSAGSVLIDTNCLIYFLEDGLGAEILEAELFRPISEGRFYGIISVISLLEVLVKPLCENREDVAEDYHASLSCYPNLEIVGIDVPVAIRAAHLRAKHKLTTADAIISATAINTGVDAILTNDEDLKVLESEIQVLIFGELM